MTLIMSQSMATSLAEVAIPISGGVAVIITLELRQCKTRTSLTAATIALLWPCVLSLF